MNTLHVKTGDTVEVISGREKNKRGKIIEANPTKGLVTIEGVNIMTKHKKARAQNEQSEIVKIAGAIRACKVMRVCPKCDKTTRTAHKIAEDGKIVTVCKKCGAEI
jgi:large subunit ribosomal protein L24